MYDDTVTDVLILFGFQAQQPKRSLVSALAVMTGRLVGLVFFFYNSGRIS